MKTKKLRKLALSRETLRTLEGQQMKTLVAGGSGCPTCVTCEASCYGSCEYSCYNSCGGSCYTCEVSCPCP